MSIIVASLHIHPIKSLGGFAVQEARITDRGFAHDRRWMLVASHDIFITQREVPAMACLHCAPSGDGFRVIDIRNGTALDLPWSIAEGEERRAKVWGDTVHVLPATRETNAWFAERLGIPCRLVYMPDTSQREVDRTYATGINSLSDGFPYLILSQASLDDLNGRMEEPLPMDRFRPNIVFAGGTAFQEDGWKEISIGTARFAVVKPCGRCAITTTDQRTGERGKEPLRTLATYRRRASTGGEVKVDFGMNAMAISGDVVRVGDLVSLLTERDIEA
ncbi:MAG: MOSC domain-containing protein [Flavobacteriales bacterium]|nr:MOSC domain-containing protein [Flavobacteriales bacterium]